MRVTGPHTSKYKGDKDAAKKWHNFALKLLGKLEARMRKTNQTRGTWRRTMVDGTRIEVTSIASVARAAPLRFVRIFTSPIEDVVEEVPDIVYRVFSTMPLVGHDENLQNSHTRDEADYEVWGYSVEEDPPWYHFSEDNIDAGRSNWWDTDGGRVISWRWEELRYNKIITTLDYGLGLFRNQVQVASAPLPILGACVFNEDGYEDYYLVACHDDNLIRFYYIGMTDTEWTELSTAQYDMDAHGTAETYHVFPVLFSGSGKKASTLVDANTNNRYLVDFTFDYDADGLPEYISAGYTDKTPSPLDYTYDMDSYDPVSGKNPYTFTKGASTSVIIGVDYVGEDQKLGLVYLSPDGGVIESGLANAFQWMPYPDGVHPVYDIYHVGRVDFAGITGYSYYHHYPPGWAKADITFSSIFLYADLRVPVLITLRLQCTDTGSSAYGQRNLYLQTPSGTYYVYGDEHGGLSSCSAYGMTSDGNIYNAPEDETDSRVTSWVVNTYPDYPNVIDTIHISWEEDAPTLLTLQGDPRRMHVACTKDGDVCLAMYVHPIIQAGVPVTDGAHIAFIRDGVTGDVYNLYDYTGIPVPPNTPESPAYYNTRETGFKEIHLLNNPNRETG